MQRTVIFQVCPILRNQIWIWGIFRPSGHIKLFDMLFGFCGGAAQFLLLGNPSLCAGAMGGMLDLQEGFLQMVVPVAIHMFVSPQFLRNEGQTVLSALDFY